MTAYRWKPALLRDPVTWRVEGHVVHAPDGAVDLRDIEHVALIEHVVKGTRFTRLDLSDARARISASITAPVLAPLNDPERMAHLDLVQRVIALLAEVDPQTPVIVAEHGRNRLAWFGVGALSALGGLGLGIAALVTTASGDAIFPFAVLALLGAFVIRANWPWAPPPTLPAGDLSRALADQRQFSALATPSGE